MRLLLDAKAWQLFLVLIGAAIGMHAVPLFGLSTVLVMACWFAWLWAIASEANRRLDLSLRKSTRWMGIGLAYAWVYICAALMLLPFLDDAPCNPRKAPAGDVLRLQRAVLSVLVLSDRRLVHPAEGETSSWGRDQHSYGSYL